MRDIHLSRRGRPRPRPDHHPASPASEPAEAVGGADAAPRPATVGAQDVPERVRPPRTASPRMPSPRSTLYARELVPPPRRRRARVSAGAPAAVPAAVPGPTPESTTFPPSISSTPRLRPRRVRRRADVAGQCVPVGASRARSQSRAVRSGQTPNFRSSETRRRAVLPPRQGYARDGSPSAAHRRRSASARASGPAGRFELGIHNEASDKGAGW